MKGIIFTADSIRAIQAGRKTQTRRVIKPQPRDGVRASVFVKSGVEDLHGHEVKPRYQGGRIFYVKETWAKVSDWTTVDESVGLPDGIIYKSDWQGEEHPKWRSPMYMPQSAARYFIEITAVDVQQLQSMKWKDIEAEGIKYVKVAGLTNYDTQDDYDYACDNATIDEFIKAWDNINAKRGHPWADNPWVEVVEFKVISKEEAERSER